MFVAPLLNQLGVSVTHCLTGSPGAAYIAASLRASGAGVDPGSTATSNMVLGRWIGPGSKVVMHGTANP